MFDYLRDLGDVCGDASSSEMLGYRRELDMMLKELERCGCACYVARRTTKIVGTYWSDKTPMPLTIGYVTVVPAEKTFSEIMVSRRFSFA